MLNKDNNILTEKKKSAVLLIFYCRRDLALQCPVFYSSARCFLYAKSDLDLLFVVPQYKKMVKVILCAFDATGLGKELYSLQSSQ